MKSSSMLSALAAVLLAESLQAAEKPRIFLTESQALRVSGEAELGETKGALSLTGGTSPQNIEVMKQFTRHCPDVVVTANRDKADYTVRFDHESASPITLFVRGNKVAIFGKNEELIFSTSTRLLANAVKESCAAITAHVKKP
jgi:hypothetical protein